ncbi:hypothetical protein [Streptomyces sp. UG1]|uniref:hypothetical protein n=1 Tax=Streptomyces sp. UG1 TaxID=3417652 RepID=UPI003CF110F1
MHPESEILARCDPIVWQMKAYEPEVVVHGGWLELEELATSLGCEILNDCVEISGFCDKTFVEWRVCLPRAEHERRGADGYPLAIEKIWRHLSYEVPLMEDEWRIAPHEGDTARIAAGQRLRAAYADLLDPLESALEPLRMDGAEEHAPRVTFWGGEEGLQAGAWDLRLCRDYEDFPDWVVISAGVMVDERLRDSFDDHFGYPDAFDVEVSSWADEQVWGHPPLDQGSVLDPRHPILLLPRPSQPLWSVALARPSFSLRADNPRRNPVIPGDSFTVDVCHQWTALDPQSLAERVEQDVRVLLPRLRGPNN